MFSFLEFKKKKNKIDFNNNIFCIQQIIMMYYKKGYNRIYILIIDFIVINQINRK